MDEPQEESRQKKKVKEEAMKSHATATAVKPRRVWARTLAVPTLGAVLLLTSAANSADVLVSSEASREVLVADLRTADDGAVSGTVVNRSNATLRDVRLMIHYGWLWRNEFKPSEESPARTDFYVVPGEIPAHGSVIFQYRPSAPLLDRRDGRFVTTAQVASFTSVSFY